MKIEISEDGTRTLVEVPEGVSTVGGGPADQVQVKGLAPRWLTLTVEGDALAVEGRQPFVVDRLAHPAGRKRLLLPGETLHLGERAWLRNPGDARSQVPRSGAQTAVVARELFSSLDAPVSRAGSLQCLTGLDLGRTYPLADGETEVGRGEASHVRIRDRHVSRRHAVLSVREGGLWIHDVGTANGVLVNGNRVTRPRPLVDGDLIELGTTLLRYGGPAREPAPPPPEPPAPAPPSPDAGPAEPARPAEPPGPEGASPGPRARVDVVLVLVGVVLAVLGALATVSAGISRGSEPGRRDPPAAPSAAGAARRSW